MKHLTTRMLLHLVFCLFFIIAAEGLFAGEPTDEAKKITSTISKTIDAYGGKDAIEEIHSLHATGAIEALMLRDHGTYELYFKRGRKLRVETKYGDSSELRILNGERGYKSADALPLEEVFGTRYVAMVYHYKHLDILHDLASGAYQIHSAGNSAVNGNSAEVFRLNDREGTIMDVYIDEHNYHIVKVTGYFSAGDKNIGLSSEFSDFRKVGGSVFPFRITNYAGGQKIAQTVIDKYSINADVADSLFEPTVIRAL